MQWGYNLNLDYKFKFKLQIAIYNCSGGYNAPEADTGYAAPGIVCFFAICFSFDQN